VAPEGQPADSAPVELTGGTSAEPATGDDAAAADGEGQDQRRRRRGRRGGRRRRNRGERGFQPGEAQVAPAESPITESHAPSAPVEITPPQRVRGPGDDYDWPWNRRAEIDAVADSSSSVPPSEIESAPARAREIEPPPVIAEEPPPPLPSPGAPARRGWWKRLTNPGS
jgi:ribonuclease E